MKRIAIVGGGIVGLATAFTLQRRCPDWRITVLEKEAELAAHQTGRNSGVIHSGIYYPPGSLKARTCLRGRGLIEEFCEREGVAWKRCGKVIVATDQSQLPGLRKLEERGLAHGLAVGRLDPAGLRAVEPACRGIEALFVPETGVVNYAEVVAALARRCKEMGVTVRTGSRLWRARLPRLELADGETLEVDGWVNCAGLYCDKLAGSSVRIVPFRGEYYHLTESAAGLCKTLIYPVPDPRFPFLGVHLTRHIDDSVGAGPNAVLALGRENYDGWSINWSEAWETLCFPGFHKLAWRYWRMGLEEQLRSLSKRLFLHSLRKLTPDLRLQDLVRSRAGIRAQAVRPDGALVDDFVIEQGPGVVHVINAPSPAATASLAIAEEVVDKIVATL